MKCEKTLEVEAYKTDDGRPTCCYWHPDQSCQFLGSRRFGTVNVCGACFEDLNRYDDMFLKPCEGCPVWTSK